MRADKVKFGRAEALKLARAADRVIASRGPKTVTFDMKKNPPAEAELAAAILGPTGNLRAPTIRVGKTLLVGFSEKPYRRALR